MSANIAQVKEDPVMTAIRDKLSEKLKIGFVELIPKETFDKMTDMAIDEFVNGPRNKRFKTEKVWLDGDDARNPTGKPGQVTIEVPFIEYNPIADSSTLPGMIYLEIVKIAKENINLTLQKDPAFQVKYDSNVGHQIMPAIEEIVSNNAGAFIQALMSNIVNFTMINAINGMRNNNGMSNYIPHVTAPKF